MAVGGQADDIHAAAQAWGGHSQTAGGQADSVIRAAEQMPPSVLVGPWADQLRTFAGEVHAGYSAVQAAYDRVASMLHKVADAVKEAQADERARDQAKSAMTQAKQALQQAEEQLQTAERRAASMPAAQSEVSSWAQRCAELQPAVEQTTRAYRKAEQRFEDANQRRQQVLLSFAHLCEQEATIAERAIPQPPAANFVDVAAVNDLQREAATLLDLPLLAVSGFATRHLAQVTRALRSVSPASLDGWTHTVLRRATIRATTAKTPSKGSSGGLLGDLHQLLDAGADAGKFLGKEGSHFADGALDATEGLGRGVYDLYELLHQPTIPGATRSLISPGVKSLIHDLGQGVTHPTRLVSAVFNWQLLEKDPARWAGALVPTIAVAALTDGTGTAAEKATDTAVDVTAPAIDGTAAGGAKLASAIKALEDPSVKLDWAKLGAAVGDGNVGADEVRAAVLLVPSKALLEGAVKVTDAGGYATTLQGLGSEDNDDPGLGPDKGADRVGSSIGKDLGGG